MESRGALCYSQTWMGLFRSRLPLAALVVVSLAGGGCGLRDATVVRSLSGPWAFQPGDDPRWSDPAFDDAAWTRIQVPRSWGRQGFADVYDHAWYRVRATAP